MKNVRYTTLMTLLGLGWMSACGSDDSGSGDNGASGSGGTASTTNTTSTNNTNNTTGTSSTTSGGGSGGEGGGAPACEITESSGIAPQDAEVPGASAVYSYGDGRTTMCISTPGPNEVCMYGVGADSDDGEGNQYAYWGGGIGVQIATIDEDGNNVPWDAEALGIAGVRFSIAGVSAAAPVRMGIVQVNTEEVSFEDQGFVWGEGFDDTSNGTENDISSDQTITAWFDDMLLPPWTDYDGDPETDDASMYDFDPTRLHSVQFQLVTGPGAERPYDYCISELTWLDEDGEAVDVPWVPSGGEGGAAGAAGAGGAGQ